MKSKLFSIILILSLLLGFVSSTQPIHRARAAGPDCYVDDTANGAKDGSSWTDAFNDLQSALVNSGCTKIHVATGIYYPTPGEDRSATFLLLSGVEIYGGYPNGGGERDQKANPTILSGDIGGASDISDYSYHVVDGSGTYASAVLDGFTIEAGNADGSELNSYGGGIYIENGSPTLRILVISGNEAYYGGGMYLQNGSPTITRVSFTNNNASRGGGLYSTGSPNLNSVEFTDNFASEAGGGMYNGGNASLNECQFNSNVASFAGGGLWVGPDASSTIHDCTFTANYAEDGGGLYAQGSVTLVDSILDQNHADNEGGGMYLSSVSPVPHPSIVASEAGDWFWTNNFIAGADLTWSIYESEDLSGELLWSGSRTADENGYISVYYSDHNIDLLPGHYLVVSDGHNEKTIVLETITMEVFDINQEIMAGTAPKGRTVWAAAGFQDYQTRINVTADPDTGMWTADFKTYPFDIIEAMRPWSYAQIYDEDGDANEAGTPPAPPHPSIVASAAGDWFWTNNFLAGAELTWSIYESEDLGGELLWSGSRTADENGYISVYYSDHNIDLLPGHYLVISDGIITKTIVFETITMEVFDINQEIMAGTAPKGRTVWAAAGSQDYQRRIFVTADPDTGIWIADFKTYPFDIIEAMRPWSYAHIYDEDGDANEAGTPPAPPPPNGGGNFTYGASISFTNLLLTGNSAANGGGGYISQSAPVFVNTTIVGNQASEAGSAIYNNQSNLSLTNSIVWGNTEIVPGPDIVYSSPDAFPTIVASILEDGDCPLNAICTGLVNSDPQFVDPSIDNYRLMPTSPGVDAGYNSVLPVDINDLDGDGNLAEPISFDLDGNQRVVMARVDLGAYEVQISNTSWTTAAYLILESQPGVTSAQVDQSLSLEGQSRWYKFTVQPSSKVIVTLTGLPANYDLALFKDIAQTFHELNSPKDLMQLSAEFAPDTFSPDTFSPDTFSPDTFSLDTFSPDTFSPDTFSPDTFSPDTFSPDTFSPDTFSPDTFSPDTFSPDTFSPDTFSPDTYSPDTFSPDTFSPDTFSPDTFSSAQTRSLITVSSHEATLGEGIRVNTWTQTGEFYVRVRGRNGAFDSHSPFHLQVMLLSGDCGQVNPVLPASHTSLPGGNYQTLIVTNLGKTEGTSNEKTTLQNNLNALTAKTNGYIVDVGADDRVSFAAQQADANPTCVYAKNLEAYAVKDIVDAFRAINPLEYIVLVGNDNAIPFFRYPDNALLASETGYSPPVKDNSTSQASLKMGYFLTQDTYGASIELSVNAQTLPIPDLPVGRLVETASDINHVVEAYLNTGDGVIHPANALVTGYDFLEDTANAIEDELTAGLSPNIVDTLIMSNQLSPEDRFAWTASDLSTSLLGSHHDLVFLAGHFSASTALAADYKTKLTTSDVLNSSTDFTNSLVYSPGCHSGYNIVNAHDVPSVTREPDWAQVFNAKGATFIGGTGYQYGDTDFIEYSERLYLEFTRQLRYSSPVAVGNALFQAKQAYLADTPVMRGIHWKSLLEATLFGLPMLQVELPNTTAPPADETIVANTDVFVTRPGFMLGLEYADLSLTPDVTEQTVTLDQISSSGGETTQVNATYLEGPDGVVVNPAEPVLPLDMLNVSHPDPNFVLRGVGWRGGTYTDLPDRLPLTGAATNDLRAPHPAFFSDTFYPVRPWNLNYYDALGSSGGHTHLALMLAQYQSSAPGSIYGTLRQFEGMNFRLYFSSNINSYDTSDPSWTNTPALAAPPDISHISSSINADGTVSFEVTVVGDPSAGIQDVWIVYTGLSGDLYGTWISMDLEQDPDDTRIWEGTLQSSSNAADLRFVVQGVNGVGLVTMMTNQGAYYRAGVDPGAPAEGQTPVTLTLGEVETSGEYGSRVTYTALATQGGDPLPGVPVVFHLGNQGRLVVTGSDGMATASFFVLAQPGEYALSVTFEGDDTYASTITSSSFEVVPGISSIVLEPTEQVVSYGISPEYTATVTSSAGLPLALKPVALTLESNGTRLYTSVVTTDYAGRARWQVPAHAPGEYTVTAWFGLPVSDDLDLSNTLYEGATSTASLVVLPFNFSGFYSPVDNPPVLNKVKAGSAVPVKFSLGGNFGLGIFATGSPHVTTIPCQNGTVDPIEETVSADQSKLNYDPLTGKYIYVWKTNKAWSNTCLVLTLKFIDGTEKTALFKFTK